MAGAVNHRTGYSTHAYMWYGRDVSMEDRSDTFNKPVGRNLQNELNVLHMAVCTEVFSMGTSVLYHTYVDVEQMRSL